MARDTFLRYSAPHMPPAPSILIAEDDPYLRAAYVRRFARTPLRVRVAHDGAEAARLIGEEAPDLLICDIMMPNHDGWWVLERYPKAIRGFPVIMLTNLDNEDTRTRCAHLGVDGFLVKSQMSLRTLVETAERLLPRRGPQ
jgi:DNA-binding response OmpR family regulator